MRTPRVPGPVLRTAAVFARDLNWFSWLETRIQTVWGDVVVTSESWLVSETEFYGREMGEPLTKRLLAFAPLMPIEGLVTDKHRSIAWEAEAREIAAGDPPRPINVDSGYLSEAKFVLATTKDREHRLYLDSGIYAEVTSAYRQGAWRPFPWTYPDYQRPESLAFFEEARRYLRRALGKRVLG